MTKIDRVFNALMEGKSFNRFEAEHLLAETAPKKHGRFCHSGFVTREAGQSSTGRGLAI